jgi:dTDP-4-dehydrorhamnose reductase
VSAGLEIWASPEATVARVGVADVRDQLEETGHAERDDDIARLASLGISATRYPVLWERCAPEAGRAPDFRWATRRLEALQTAGVEPIVTLLHHGSGPSYTDLLDPDFPQKLAAYACAVAAAFPWVRRWTPVNEPLTTARFSTLYGHWYPNSYDDHAAFGRALAHEALGTLLTMQAIRAHVPGAELVVTEDLQTFTALDDDPNVAAAVAHQRERSFLSLDLLLGRVVPGHALYPYLTGTCGVAAGLLERIARNATPPSLIGWNYYPYSERVFRARDGGVEDLPRVTVAPGSLSAAPALRAAHARFGLPFGLSEVHVNASERGRMRWLAQRHAELVRLGAEGLPVRACGVWAAFGMIDWNSLLTRREGHREDGVFSFASPGERPRETALADAVRALSAGGSFAVPEESGWWERQSAADELRLHRGGFSPALRGRVATAAADSLAPGRTGTGSSG